MTASSFKVESGIQLLARLTKRPSVKHFYPQLFQSGPNPGDVIEIKYSEDSSNGLLSDIICSALLPLDFGGAETGVLLFNCSGNINFNTLFTSMRKKITSGNKKITEKEGEVIVEKLLSNLFVLDIHDVTQYYTSIYNLENVLTEHPNITIVIFDTVTEFYWLEQSFKIMKMDTYLKKLLFKIQNVTREHKVIIIYTKPDYFNSRNAVTDISDVCYEFPSLEGVNYKISICCDKGNTYRASIKSHSIQLERQFCMEEDHIQWI